MTDAEKFRALFDAVKANATKPQRFYVRQIPCDCGLGWVMIHAKWQDCENCGFSVIRALEEGET